MHSSVNGCPGSSHILAIVKSAVMTFGMHASLSIMAFSGYRPSSGIVGSYSISVPSFLRNRHTVLRGWWEFAV